MNEQIDLLLTTAIIATRNNPRAHHTTQAFSIGLIPSCYSVKKVLERIKKMLNGRDAQDVEHDLAAGVVKKSTLDKIEKLNKDLADTCLEHVQRNPLIREFWKQLSHIKIECDKEREKERLSALQIPMLEG